MGRLILVLLAALLVASGCTRSNDPLLVNDAGRETNTPAPVTLGGAVEFSDDFEAGLDPAVWYREFINGVSWVHGVEAGNGYVYSPAQQTIDPNNRFDDVLTLRDDFDDFTVTWDMRFHTRSWHQDHRYLYFRSGNQPNPHGYVVHIGVWIPTIPDHVLQILKLSPDGTSILHPAYISYPWVLDQWYSFRLEVAGNQFKLKVWKREEAEPADWIIEAVDPDATYSAGRIGFGDYWYSVTDVDNVVVTTPVVPVSLDIKPGSCPNRLNAKYRPEGGPARQGGVVPAAILGTADLDVTQIDVSSLSLAGVAPVRHAYEDVASPANGGKCDCVMTGADGHVDLTLKFDHDALVAAIAAVSSRQTVPLTISGQLLDGTAITGVDCVVIVP